MSSVLSQILETDSSVPLRGLKANSVERLTLVGLIDEFENPKEGSFSDPDRQYLAMLLEESSTFVQLKRSLLLAKDGWEFPEC